MLVRTSQRRLVFSSIGMLALVAALVLPGQAQEEDAQQLGVTDKLTTEYQRTTASLRKDLIKGAASPTSAEGQQALDVAAQWFAYRPTWIAFRQDPKALGGVVEEFEKDIVNQLLIGFNAKANKDTVLKFGPHLAKRFGELFEKKFSAFPIAQVNAAQMLPLMARLKQEEVADLLVNILNDKKQHDAVKHYAAKGLAEFFPAAEIVERDLIVEANKNGPIHKKKERYSQRVDALVNYLHAKRPAYLDENAIRFVRREAIAALAQAAIPYIYAKQAKGKKDQVEALEGAVAHGLLRVLASGPDGLNPPASTPEKIEAVLGICRLKQTDQPVYDPEPGVLLVGVALRDILDDYDRDWLKINTEKKIPRVAWRLQAERLRDGLKELVANTPKGSPAQTQAQRLDKACDDFFKQMQQKGYGKLEQFNLFQDGLIKGWEAKLEKDSPAQIYKGYPKLPLSTAAPKVG